MHNEILEIDAQESAHFEYVTIPEGQTFLMRIDDYPYIKCRWNYHPEFEIHLVRNASGFCYIGDHIGHFDSGHLMMVGSNLPHNWTTPLADGKKIEKRDLVLQFHPDRVRAAIRDFPEITNIEHLFERAARGIVFTGRAAKQCENILESMINEDPLLKLGKFIQVLALMSKTDEYQLLSSQHFIDHFEKGDHQQIEDLEKAFDYIQENYLHNPKLSKVAEVVGMSESAFSRFFKAQTGNTYSSHITSLRIWTARRLLSETNTPITDICYESGFSNISNFNRTFMRSAGMTPSQYRKATKMKNSSMV